MLTLLLLFFLGTATSRALPMNITASAAGSKIPMLPPAQLNQPSLNPEDVATFTNMFLNLFKGIADWRNIVAADTVQSMWQSPPIADISHRLFGAQVYK